MTDGPPGASTEGGDASSTGAAFDCEANASFTALQTAPEAALIDPPMNIDPAWGGASPALRRWRGRNQVGSAAITFDVEVPCDRTYYLWGLTWDQIHGVTNCSGITNADAFFVSVDGGVEIQWSYGCQGCSNPDGVWTWTVAHEYMAS
jgi:hypothetical protein